MILACLSGNLTKAQYEEVRKEVKWETDHPAGLLIHAAGFDENGRLTVADVWESADHMNRFFEKRLGPALTRFGIPIPTGETFTLHNANIMPEGLRFKV